MKTEYLLFNLFIIAGPLLVAFIPRWKKVSPRGYVRAFLLVSVPYLLWDALVTNVWWTFNPRYVTGYHIGPLPVEEILFFASVPFACLILYVNLPHTRSKPVPSAAQYVLSALAAILGAIAAYQGKWYTAAVLTLACSLWVIFRRRGEIRVSAMQWGYAAFILATTTVFNGYLTARPVVLYAERYLSNLRIGTIPVEDYLYGLILVFMFTFVYRQPQSAG